MDPTTTKHEGSRELVQGVIHDAREMATAEVKKLGAKARYVGQEVGGDVKLAGVAAVVGNVAAILFGQALGFVLVALGLPAWAAFGIIAVVFGAIAGGLGF